MPDPRLPKINPSPGRSTVILEKEALSSPDPHIRAYAVYLLGLEKDPSRRVLFLSAMRDEDKRVRAQAAHALATLGERSIPDLAGLLHDNDWRIRYRAAEALGKIPSHKGVDHLIRSLSDEKDHVRYMAIKSLGNLGEKIAVPGIISRLSDENEYVRRMAAISLGMIGGEDALSAIRNALPSESTDSVRIALQNELQKKHVI